MNGVQFMVAVSLFSGFFVAICIYFDGRRRKDPEYRRKLKMRREKVRLLKKAQVMDISDSEEVRDEEMIILHEIQLAETLMAQQDYDKAVIHFANAIAVCVDPHRLLLALKETLPAHAFNLLIQLLASNYGKQFSRFQEEVKFNSIVQSRSLTRF